MDQVQDWSKGIRQTVKDTAEGVVALQNEDGSAASGVAGARDMWLPQTKPSEIALRSSPVAAPS